MGIFLLVIIFGLISLGLIFFAKYQEQRYSYYDSSYIKGAVRGHLGRFEYRSVLEAKRRKINSPNSKF